ncbi:hypothetical protein DFH06DRAFT_1421620 [Mycena polygramma]|nr:hypothetical protein DFH06DRAFT_1421620 [Mycena polygramma]
MTREFSLSVQLLSTIQGNADTTHRSTLTPHTRTPQRRDHSIPSGLIASHHTQSSSQIPFLASLQARLHQIRSPSTSAHPPWLAGSLRLAQSLSSSRVQFPRPMKQLTAASIRTLAGSKSIPWLARILSVLLLPASQLSNYSIFPIEQLLARGALPRYQQFGSAESCGNLISSTSCAVVVTCYEGHIEDHVLPRFLERIGQKSSHPQGNEHYRDPPGRPAKLQSAFNLKILSIPAGTVHDGHRTFSRNRNHFCFSTQFVLQFVSSYSADDGGSSCVIAQPEVFSLQMASSNFRVPYRYAPTSFASAMVPSTSRRSAQSGLGYRNNAPGVQRECCVLFSPRHSRAVCICVLGAVETVGRRLFLTSRRIGFHLGLLTYKSVQQPLGCYFSDVSVLANVRSALVDEKPEAYALVICSPCTHEDQVLLCGSDPRSAEDLLASLEASSNKPDIRIPTMRPLFFAEITNPGPLHAHGRSEFVHFFFNGQYGFLLSIQHYKMNTILPAHFDGSPSPELRSARARRGPGFTAFTLFYPYFALPHFSGSPSPELRSARARRGAGGFHLSH